jgi:hypothetical protein
MAATVSTRITRLAAISPRTTATNLQADLTIGDFRLGADYLRDAANSFGLASTVTAGDDVRFWAGQTFANRATAPARIYESGNFTFGTGTKTLVWDGSDLSLGGASLVAGTAASTVVSNAATGAAESGALALAGAKLAKAGGDILTGIMDINTTTYDGAVRVGDVAWNAGTGAVTGGSGVVITKAGLLGVKAGVTNFSITTAGDVTLIGTVTAAAGAIGGFSLGADYIRDAANSFGMASTVTGGDDVRFWAGAAFADRATAPLRLYESGDIYIGSGTFAGNVNTAGFVKATGSASGTPGVATVQGIPSANDIHGGIFSGKGTGYGVIGIATGSGTAGDFFNTAGTGYAGFFQGNTSAPAVAIVAGAGQQAIYTTSGITAGTLLVSGDSIFSTEIYRSVDNSYLRISGGSTAGGGADIVFFGGTHATTPNELQISASGGIAFNDPTTVTGTFGVTGAVTYSGAISGGLETSVTGSTHTVGTTEELISNAYVGGSMTLTLPDAATFPGRKLTVCSKVAQTTVSNASNVYPLGSVTLGTAILASGAGKYADLISDGTYWRIWRAN